MLYGARLGYVYKKSIPNSLRIFEKLPKWINYKLCQTWFHTLIETSLVGPNDAKPEAKKLYVKFLSPNLTFDKSAKSNVNKRNRELTLSLLFFSLFQRSFSIISNLIVKPVIVCKYLLGSAKVQIIPFYIYRWKYLWK